MGLMVGGMVVKWVGVADTFLRSAGACRIFCRPRWGGRRTPFCRRSVLPNFLPVSVVRPADAFLPSVGAAEFSAGFGDAADGHFFSAIHVEGDGSAVFPPRPAVFLLTFVARCFLVGRWRMAKCGRRMPIQR